MKVREQGLVADVGDCLSDSLNLTLNRVPVTIRFLLARVATTVPPSSDERVPPLFVRQRADSHSRHRSLL